MRGGPSARQRRGTHLAQHALQVGAQHRHQVQGRGWAAAGRRHGAGVGLPQASGRLRQRRQAGGAAGGREGAAGASARCWTFSLDVLHRKGVPGAAQGRWRLTLKVDWRDAGESTRRGCNHGYGGAPLPPKLRPPRPQEPPAGGQQSGRPGLRLAVYAM